MSVRQKVVAAVAGHHAEPHITMTAVHRSITAGTRPAFSYKTTHVPRTARLQLQRQVGSKHVWKKVANLSARSGSVTAAAVPLGKYAYRVAVFQKRTMIATGKTRTIYSYGTIPYERLCASWQDYGYGCSTGTVEVGSSVFSYAVWGSNNGYPIWQTPDSLLSTSCRSLTVRFASDTFSLETPGNTYVKVVQATADVVNAQTPPDTVGEVTGPLTGDAFNLDITNDGQGHWYLNGSAECWSESGLR